KTSASIPWEPSMLFSTIIEIYGDWRRYNAGLSELSGRSDRELYRHLSCRHLPSRLGKSLQGPMSPPHSLPTPAKPRPFVHLPQGPVGHAEGGHRWGLGGSDVRCRQLRRRRNAGWGYSRRLPFTRTPRISAQRAGSWPVLR